MPWVMAVVVGIGAYSAIRLFTQKKDVTEVERKQAWIDYYNKQAAILIKKGYVEDIIRGNMLIAKSNLLINNLMLTPKENPPEIVA